MKERLRLVSSSHAPSGYFRTITRSLYLRFPTDLADFGEGLAENGKAGPLEALRRRGKEVFCESGYSRTITWCPQLQFATDLADFGERKAENDKAWLLEAR